jgi:hypothetical protein
VILYRKAPPVTIDYDIARRDTAGLPYQFDEFVCSRCLLIHHRHNMADEDARVCFDCS